MSDDTSDPVAIATVDPWPDAEDVANKLYAWAKNREAYFAKDGRVDEHDSARLLIGAANLLLKIKEEKLVVGNIHLKKDKPMFLRQGVGSFGDKNDPDFEIDVNMSGFTPIITSTKTGKVWTINWHQLLSLAIAAGVDSDPFDEDESDDQ